MDRISRLLAENKITKKEAARRRKQQQQNRSLKPSPTRAIQNKRGKSTSTTFKSEPIKLLWGKDQSDSACLVLGNTEGASYPGITAIKIASLETLRFRLNRLQVRIRPTLCDMQPFKHDLKIQLCERLTTGSKPEGIHYQQHFVVKETEQIVDIPLSKARVDYTRTAGQNVFLVLKITQATIPNSILKQADGTVIEYNRPSETSKSIEYGSIVVLATISQIEAKDDVVAD